MNVRHGSRMYSCGRAGGGRAESGARLGARSGAAAADGALEGHRQAGGSARDKQLGQGDVSAGWLRGCGDGSWAARLLAAVGDVAHGSADGVRVVAVDREAGVVGAQGLGCRRAMHSCRQRRVLPATERASRAFTRSAEASPKARDASWAAARRVEPAAQGRASLSPCRCRRSAE